MARKPKPTALKILTGNKPGNAQDTEPKPPLKIPEVPPHLCDDAKREWHRVCEMLHAIGILTVADRSVLAAYCTAYALWERSWQAINKMSETGKLGAGLMISTTNGNLIQNPLVGTANKAAGDMVRFASELGMTPAARTRIKAGPSKKSSVDKYFD